MSFSFHCGKEKKYDLDEWKDGTGLGHLKLMQKSDLQKNLVLTNQKCH